MVPDSLTVGQWRWRIGRNVQGRRRCGEQWSVRGESLDGSENEVPEQGGLFSGHGDFGGLGQRSRWLGIQVQWASR